MKNRLYIKLFVTLLAITFAIPMLKMFTCKQVQVNALKNSVNATYETVYYFTDSPEKLSNTFIQNYVGNTIQVIYDERFYISPFELEQLYNSNYFSLSLSDNGGIDFSNGCLFILQLATYNYSDQLVNSIISDVRNLNANILFVSAYQRSGYTNLCTNNGVTFMQCTEDKLFAFYDRATMDMLSGNRNGITEAENLCILMDGKFFDTTNLNIGIHDYDFSTIYDNYSDFRLLTECLFYREYGYYADQVNDLETYCTQQEINFLIYCPIDINLSYYSYFDVLDCTERSINWGGIYAELNYYYPEESYTYFAFGIWSLPSGYYNDLYELQNDMVTYSDYEITIYIFECDPFTYGSNGLIVVSDSDLFDNPYYIKDNEITEQNDEGILQILFSDLFDDIFDC